MTRRIDALPLTFALSLSLFLISGAPVAAQADAPRAEALWTPAECDSLPEESWEKFRAEMKDARVGSTVWAPHPFPETEDEVLADLRIGLEGMWRGAEASEVPAGDRALLEGLRAGTLEPVIERVAEWTPLRCHPVSPRQFYFLVRLFDRDGGEVARVALNQTGLMGSWVIAPESTAELEAWRAALPSRARMTQDAERLARAEGGAMAEARHHQLVTTVAGTQRCHRLQPCLAFEQRGSFYLFNPGPGGGLFTFDRDSPRVGEAAIRQLSRRGPNATAEGIDSKTEGLFSIGTEWVRGRRIGPPR